MSRSRLYYSIRPWIPRRLQLFIRRWLVRRQRLRVSDRWPILASAAQRPEEWCGWPDGKQFAFVLTHDVETARGHDRCLQLASLEETFDVRSSFNFVPERYAVSSDLRNELSQRGFEVGVHGLVHDGRLFQSRKQFVERARKINMYLKDWQAVGFRSPSMLHNLDWIHDLDIEYDASTFDTDPFEPQPDGVGTIFPFWLSSSNNGDGYIELPYTLPQDSTLFVLMKEETIDIWKKKIDWIADHGGMVLANIHPDYISSEAGRHAADEYPIDRCRELLEYVKSKYAGRYWNPLPRDLARFWSAKMKQPVNRPVRNKIWIDLDNSPHVPLFKPIIRELERRGFRIMLTARDAYQVCALADYHGLPYTKIGRHYGKQKLMKVAGFLFRIIQLLPVVIREKPAVAVCHGSRAQTVLSRLLRIPTIAMADYEHTRHLPFLSSNWVIVPEVIPEGAFSKRKEFTRRYAGIKEDIYVPDFRPDPSILTDLGLKTENIVVTIRPPATDAHYHRAESTELFKTSMEHLIAAENTQIVLLPRSEKQACEIRSRWPSWFSNGKVIIPDHSVDGLNLIWHSDLVVSGGGTMNREAAALGTPVYSIFRGTIGAVDNYLSESGRLVLIESPADVEKKIQLEQNDRGASIEKRNRDTLMCVVDHIESILRNPDCT